MQEAGSVPSIRRLKVRALPMRIGRMGVPAMLRGRPYGESSDQ